MGNTCGASARNLFGSMRRRSYRNPPEDPKHPSSRHRPDTSSSVKTNTEPGSVLGYRTDNLKDLYTLGRKIGHGQFGTTYLCTEISTAKEYACKSIAKRKLASKDDAEDVRREIQIMHHLSGHSNVVQIKAAYEDNFYVYIVMELCTGGELFDRIVQGGHFTERKAAELIGVIVRVVEICHSLGVMHRDLKPENFLLVGPNDDSSLKTIDFGLSVFFKPGT